MNGKSWLMVGTFLLALILSGCAGTATNLSMNDALGQGKTVVFPNGTVFGGASTEQASTLAQIFVDSHNMAMKEFADVKGGIQRVDERTQRIDERTQKIEELSRKNLETADMTLRILTKLAKEQGTGEITVFFPVGVGHLQKDSMEYGRLVDFADYLARESKGRKVLFITIGSASAFGDQKVNENLAKKRSDAPTDVLDKYLVNIPHNYYKVYGTGDLYSPKNVKMKEHERYQHVRIIAFYEVDQIPPLPAGN